MGGAVTVVTAWMCFSPAWLSLQESFTFITGNNSDFSVYYEPNVS